MTKASWATDRSCRARRRRGFLVSLAPSRLPPPPTARLPWRRPRRGRYLVGVTITRGNSASAPAPISRPRAGRFCRSLPGPWPPESNTPWPSMFQRALGVGAISPLARSPPANGTQTRRRRLLERSDFGGALALAAGEKHTLSIRPDGSVTGAGVNGGRLGNGSRRFGCARHRLRPFAGRQFVARG